MKATVCLEGAGRKNLACPAGQGKSILGLALLCVHVLAIAEKVRLQAGG